ncbi:DHH family phosphoesterase [Candidatus Woesearchaeota archaeon]|nr:DHH family phosphoesterase [Candidatus Woesearchaeota archaeon]
MALSETQLQELRNIFDSCARPVILFDDDPDGLAGFLLIYKHIREGRGMPVKNAPELGPEMAQKVNDYAPDIVIIVDVPVVNQEFLDKIKTRKIWIDHHPPVKRHGVEYYNPRIENSDDNRPASYWIYKALKENLWIAMIGIIGDWHMPEKEILDEFINKHPALLSKDIKKPEVALHDSRLGELIKIISFNLKGKTSDVIKSIKVFTRIKDPYELLEQKTSGGKFIYKKYSRLREKYNEILKRVKVKPQDKLVLFVYSSPDYSFSKEISNELIYKHPDKIILVAWEYNDEYKCSLRSTKTKLPPLIDKALEGVNGYGGGHDHASGACVKIKDFGKFVENFKGLI